MPWGDGTGPLGLGPMTGRGAGYCAGFGVPGFMNPWPRFGRGFRRAFGFGRGLGLGRGWAWRARAIWAPLAPWAPEWVVPVQRELTRDEERELLKAEKEQLERELKEIERRLKELK